MTQPTGPGDWVQVAANIYQGGSGVHATTVQASSAQAAHDQWLVHYSAQQAQMAAQNKKRYNSFLALPPLEITHAPVKRRVSQPRFWMSYDTLTDAERRLNGSIVYIGVYPYWIDRIAEDPDKPGEFLLAVLDEENAQFHVRLDNESVDLRSFEPQYVTLDGVCGWLFRWPSRHQKQGADPTNIGFRPFGNSQAVSSRHYSVQEILRSLRTPDVLRWSTDFSRLMKRLRAISALRLSPNIAVGCSKEKKDTIRVEYRGRPIGTLDEDVITLSDGGNRPWIVNAVQEIGCKVATSQSE